jgi:hypothetical protein
MKEEERMGKMSNAKFRTILLSIVAIIIAFAIIATQTALTFAASLDWALGRGQRHVTILEGADAGKAAYYDMDYASPEEREYQTSELIHR